MKSFSCGAVVPGCTHSFRGRTEDEILTQVAHHARQDHGLTEIPEELVGAVRANIVSR
jgi:predicted small metal-binding protein